VKNVASAAEPVLADEFDFNAYMTERAVMVQGVLDRVIAPDHPKELTDAMRYAMLSEGKKIRPALCLAACELVGGNVDAAMPTACACEMIHVMSLVHDDLPCMDNDNFRRGRATTHVKFGEDIALLAGDALLAYSFGHVAKATEGIPPERVVKVVSILGRAVGVHGLAGGQTVDIVCEGKNVDAATLEFIHLHKTAALLEAAVVCGAVIGGATEEELERLSKYARDIGLAFQVIDDILDVTQTTEQLGKTAAKDLDSDKTTYPKLLGLERSKEVAAELISDAIHQLRSFDQERAAPLIGLAEYIRDRKK